MNISEDIIESIIDKKEPSEEELEEFKTLVNDWIKLDDQIRKLIIATKERKKYKLLNDSLKNHQKPNERLALHTQDKIHIVNINDILRCESSVNYTEFHFGGGKKLLVTKTLKDFEDLLADQGFYRVHQSHLLNTKYIKEFVKTDGGYLLMNDGFNVPVSVRKKAEVIKMLEEL